MGRLRQKAPDSRILRWKTNHLLFAYWRRWRMCSLTDFTSVRWPPVCNQETLHMRRDFQRISWSLSSNNGQTIKTSKGLEINLAWTTATQNIDNYTYVCSQNCSLHAGMALQLGWWLGMRWYFQPCLPQAALKSLITEQTHFTLLC